MNERHYDILIIGAGAGGGTVARELAPLCRDGKRIAVLERGRRFRDSEFDGDELRMAGKVYFASGGFLTESRDMTLAFGRGYGGSTLVYTGTSIDLPAHVADAWAVPGLSHGDIAARTAKYEAENNVHKLDDGLINENNDLFAQGCRALGLNVRKFPVNIKGCRGSGMCNMGCPNQAKQGTNRVQLPEAEAQGVEVVTHCRVERIGERFVDARIEPFPFGLPPEWEPGPYRVHAKVIVVCGGAVNTSALLLRSSLPGHFPALGRYFTCHPALTLIAQHDRPITNYYGFPKTYYCDDFERSDHFILETCMYFPFTTAKNIATFGEAHSTFLEDFRKLQMILVLAGDPALRENRIEVDGDGEPRVHYSFADSVRAGLVKAQKVAGDIFFAAGARRIHLPAAAEPVIDASMVGDLDTLVREDHFELGRIPISAAHMMGGCRMGTSPEDSVTDAWGRVHGFPWLFCADSSLFPKSSEVNPYLTVMALADRVAEGLRTEAGSLLA
jgi:choline dehydrogenase-like flavoprotein